MRLIFATKNQGKLNEIRMILSGSGIDVVSAEEAGVTDEVEEDGTTLEENALKKARHVFERVRTWVAAEDAGLFTDALNGEPGVRTARWPGEQGGHADYTLTRLEGVPTEQRTARFIAVIALIDPDGGEHLFEGRVEGRIPEIARGTSFHHSLPYDTVFEPVEGGGRTFAEMGDEEKSKFSHRARAIQKMKAYIGHSIEAMIS